MDKGILLLITLLISHKTVINAAPMSFRDSITSMSTISKSYSYLESSYAISSKESFGININENKGDTYKLKAGEFFYLRRLMRVNKISGQLNGIKKMIEEQRYCPEIITQLKAVSSACQSLEIIMLEKHLESCVLEAFQSKDKNAQAKKIKELSLLYKR